MRTLLLLSLLALSFGFTTLSLLAVRYTLQRQVQLNLRSDLAHSVYTFVNIEHQRREMLEKETALLADLPSLKALMTTNDARTMQDSGKDFWKISGSDLFQLYDTSGKLVVSYGLGQSPTGVPAEANSPGAASAFLDAPNEARALSFGDHLYEITTHPLFFGSRTRGTLLGFVVLGSAIDEKVAREVSQATDAEVAFTIDGKVAVSTLGPRLQSSLNGVSILKGLAAGKIITIPLNGERYLAAVQPLGASGTKSGDNISLVVLRSHDDATRFAVAINRWLLGLGALALLLGSLIATSISRRITRPLEALVEGARALGRGDFTYRLASGGTAEIRELASAFDHMQRELQSSQRALVDSERLATIGRMANSISHDLRHYISAMYANAEFLSLSTTSQPEREELLFEVAEAVQGMTDLLDSLLGFSRTGRGLLLSYESIPYLAERAVGLLRAHPEARSLNVRFETMPSIEAWVDATKVIRAIFNLLLNGCQAANRGDSETPCVTLELTESRNDFVLRIVDNGPGIATALIATMFEPFVSSGRENGSGLGLTLARHIAHEHGGEVILESSVPGETVFLLSFSKPALRSLKQRDEIGVSVEKREHQRSF